MILKLSAIFRICSAGSVACALLTTASGADGDTSAHSNDVPVPPTIETLQQDADRKAYEEAMTAQAAQIRAKRTATSGIVPHARIDAEGYLRPEFPPHGTMEDVEQRRAERIGRVYFTVETMLALADSPERQPEQIRNAMPDDPRFRRPRLLEAYRQGERA